MRILISTSHRWGSGLPYNPLAKLSVNQLWEAGDSLRVYLLIVFLLVMLKMSATRFFVDPGGEVSDEKHVYDTNDDTYSPYEMLKEYKATDEKRDKYK